jgi:flagellar hook-basal body protein
VAQRLLHLALSAAVRRCRVEIELEGNVMGIFDALTTAVAGLQAQSFALQNISGNIANSQTTGYKEIDTSFADLVSQAALQQQTTDGVIASSAATNTVQGTINSTSVSTDMAINGDGFFVVAQPTGFTDNQPNFNGVSDYTRAGDFQLNANGNLVNGAGYYLMGIPVSATTGNPTGSVPQVLQFQNSFVPAQETTQIQYQVNLPSKPAATLDESNFQANPIAGAQIIGSGATLLPDAVATSSSSITTLTATTALTSGDTYTVNDGSNTTTFTAGGTSTVADLINAINSGPANNVTGSREQCNGRSQQRADRPHGHLADCIHHGWRHRPSVDRICGDDRTTGRSLDARCGDVGADIDRHGRRRHPADHHVRHGGWRRRDARAIANRDPGSHRGHRLG